METSYLGTSKIKLLLAEKDALGVTDSVIVAFVSPTLLFNGSDVIEAAFKVSGTTPVSFILEAEAFWVPAELNS